MAILLVLMVAGLGEWLRRKPGAPWALRRMPPVLVGLEFIAGTFAFSGGAIKINAVKKGEPPR